MAWFQKGASNEDLNKREKEQGSKVNRLWLPPETSMKVIFLDEEPFCFYEHNPKINGSFKHVFTCRKGVSQNDPVCPLCTSDVKRYYVGYLTVLDASGWKNDKGELVIYTRRLIPMKLESLRKLNLLKSSLAKRAEDSGGKRKGTLTGAMYTIQRSGKKAATCGDVFEYEEHVDLNDQKYWYKSLKENKKVKPEAFSYEEIFKPMSSAEMRAVIANIGGGSDPGVEQEDEEIGGGDADEVY